MSDNDVPDSTDWLSTPLTGLAAVENALRCQVCKDFYKTPMLTTCSHTFCSLCIRRALANDGKCPLCRSPEQELKLRSNWSLEETIDAFVKARPATLQLARAGRSGSTGKRKAESRSQQESDEPTGKRVRTSARLRKNQSDQMMVDSFPEEEEEEETAAETRGGDDDAYVPEPDDGLVACPVCQSRMKDWQVFRHLETCSGPPPPTKKKEVEKRSAFDQTQRQQTKSLDRLPALNYSVLKDNALRRKLSELGISNQGPRNLLEKRHKEWITLWNANCDAARPKKRFELQHDLDIWERVQGGRLPMGRMTQHTPMVKDKDFDAAGWSAKHNDEYKELIASARKSRMEAKKKAEEAIKSSNAEPSKQVAKTSMPARSQYQPDSAGRMQGGGALSSSQGLPHRVPRAGSQRTQGGSVARELNQRRQPRQGEYLSDYKVNNDVELASRLKFDLPDAPSPERRLPDLVPPEFYESFRDIPHGTYIPGGLPNQTLPPLNTTRGKHAMPADQQPQSPGAPRGSFGGAGPGNSREASTSQQKPPHPNPWPWDPSLPHLVPLDFYDSPEKPKKPSGSQQKPPHPNPWPDNPSLPHLLPPDFYDSFK